MPGKRRKNTRRCGVNACPERVGADSAAGRRAVKAARARPTRAAATIPPAQTAAIPRATEAVSAPLERERSTYDGDTAIKLYLREIGQVKLLTPQEEIELAARIKKGDKKAPEQMIKANLRLVVKIAHDYEGFGLPVLELISEGNIGLMKAVQPFDPANEPKLSTSAPR